MAFRDEEAPSAAGLQSDESTLAASEEQVVPGARVNAVMEGSAPLAQILAVRSSWGFALRFAVASMNFGMRPITVRDRSTVEGGAGPAARILSPSSIATDGVLCATRREAGVTGFDCGVWCTFSGVTPPLWWLRPYLMIARGCWSLCPRGPEIEGREGLAP